MEIFNKKDDTNFEESKAIGKLEDTEYYWIGFPENNMKLFCTKAQMELTKKKPYADKLEIYSAYKKEEESKVKKESMEKNSAYRLRYKKTRKVANTSDLTPDKYFYSNDGQVFKTVSEMAEGVEKMSEETFAYHCNNEKNDFRNWVKEVLLREKLAKLLKRVKTKDQFAAAVKIYATFIIKKPVKTEVVENTEKTENNS